MKDADFSGVARGSGIAVNAAKRMYVVTNVIFINNALKKTNEVKDLP